MINKNKHVIIKEKTREQASHKVKKNGPRRPPKVSKRKQTQNNLIKTKGGK